MYRSRWNKVKAYLRKKRMDAYIVKAPSDIRYLFSSHLPHDSALATYLVIFRKGGVVAITSSLEAHRTRTQGAKGANIQVFSALPNVVVDHKNHADALANVLKKGKARKAFCDGPIKVKGVRTVEDGRISELRLYKEPYEMRCIKEACRITDKASTLIDNILKPGMTEKEIQVKINSKIIMEGGDSCAFQTIAASGPHSAYPHHDITDRKVKKGEAVTCDLGAVWSGYCADLTRTYFAGSPSKKMREIYGVVLESYRAGVKACKVGCLCGDIDKACREVVVEYGYGKFFPHSTGHGIGLDVHEGPGIVPSSKTKLAKGMVFTVEPGIYVPKVGGVRIENDVYIGPSGPEVLNRARIPRY